MLGADGKINGKEAKLVEQNLGGKRTKNSPLDNFHSSKGWGSFFLFFF